MRAFALLSAMIFMLAWGTALGAQSSVEKHLPLDASIAPNGRAVELRWPDAKPPLVGSIIVNRRVWGQTGINSWQALGPAVPPRQTFTDKTVAPGVAYEYQVMRVAKDIVDVGYWLTGVDVPAPVLPGSAYIVVDETVSAALAPYLDRFERDLTGDGWQVMRHQAPRGDASDPRRNLIAALSVKTWLAQQYARDPFGRHAIILVGHVPLPMSGLAAPDGHGQVPHATDLFYADIDGAWRAGPDGMLQDNALRDGTIEMAVGRIDFAALSAGDTAREVSLLQDYFNKNHHWRMGFLGDPRQAYGQNQNLLGEQYALRNIVGPQAVRQGGHDDAGPQQLWLWGVDFGPVDAQAYGRDFAGKAVFAVNFGSHKQKIERPLNAMTAYLAQPWYPLAVGWGGRPAWWLHHMALGGSIGEVHRRTVNNGLPDTPYRETMEYFPTGLYLWRNPVWVNLLGDPTLRAFMLAPPSRVTLQQDGTAQEVSWTASPDPDVTGYRIWRSAEPGAPFRPLGTGALITGLSFLDQEPLPGARYMVRAYGLKDVYAGSFYTFSQGAFSGAQTADAQDILLETRVGVPLEMPALFDDPYDGDIHAFVTPPQTGRLDRVEGTWRYTPSEGFSGQVEWPYSVSGRWRTQRGMIRLTVTQ